MPRRYGILPVDQQYDYALTTAATEFISKVNLSVRMSVITPPPKAETTIRINKAMNVLAEQAEIEVDRKRDAYTFHGYRYDLVKVRGWIKNEKINWWKSIDVEITKELTAKYLKALESGKTLNRQRP